MSVGVFPFMLQLLVYVREKYKNYSSLFRGLQCLEIQAARSDVRRLHSWDM